MSKLLLLVLKKEVVPLLVTSHIPFLGRSLLAIASDQGLVFYGDEERGQQLLHSQGWAYCEAEHPVVSELATFLEQLLEGEVDIEREIVCDPLVGTPFQKEVWQALQGIPFGETITYQELAERLGRPGAAQAVGTAVGKNPWAIVVPCHRVLPKNGGIGNYMLGVKVKSQLLVLEKGKKRQDR